MYGNENKGFFRGLGNELLEMVKVVFRGGVLLTALLVILAVFVLGGCWVIGFAIELFGGEGALNQITQEIERSQNQCRNAIHTNPGYHFIDQKTEVLTVFTEKTVR